MASRKPYTILGTTDTYQSAKKGGRSVQIQQLGAVTGNPPTVTIISPTPGTVITPTTRLVFRIQDNTGFRRILPALKWRTNDQLSRPHGEYEIIHDGEGFTPLYAGSIRTEITPGLLYEYDVARVGGLLAHPTLVPFAFDLSGNEPA